MTTIEKVFLIELSLALLLVALMWYLDRRATRKYKAKVVKISDEADDIMNVDYKFFRKDLVASGNQDGSILATLRCFELTQMNK